MNSRLANLISAAPGEVRRITNGSNPSSNSIPVRSGKALGRGAAVVSLEVAA